jgi:hypothetical protein
MNDAVKSALLWGLVGAMAFLALYQGYVLATSGGIGFPAALAAAIVVGAITTGSAYVLERRLAARSR